MKTGPQREFWEVKIEDEAEVDWRRLTDNDKRVIRVWGETVRDHGPAELQKQPDWNDHELKGEWIGHRASMFSPAGRIIYRVIDPIRRIIVARITTDHDYRKDRKK